MNDTTELLPHIKLRFNIEHPTLEECYAYGYECARVEINEEDNPYRIGSQESEHWIEGWWAGFYGEDVVTVATDTLNIDTVIYPTVANDDHYHHDKIENFFIKFLEISGIIAVSAIVGYQMIEMVA